MEDKLNHIRDTVAKACSIPAKYLFGQQNEQTYCKEYGSALDNLFNDMFVRPVFAAYRNLENNYYKFDKLPRKLKKKFKNNGTYLLWKHKVPAKSIEINFKKSLIN